MEEEMAVLKRLREDGVAVEWKRRAADLSSPIGPALSSA
jgi:hypothetical protein